MLFLSLSLSGCGGGGANNAAEKQQLIDYLSQKGEVKGDITWLSLPCDNKDATPYLLYNASTGYFGFAYHSADYTYSEAAMQKVLTYETKGYTFFEYGRPWCGTYYYSYRQIHFDTLEEKKGIATYEISEEAFDTSTHKFYSSTQYIKNITIQRDDNSNLNSTGKNSMPYWVNQVAKGLNDSHIVYKLPYVF